MIILLCDGSSIGNPGECKVGVVVWQRGQDFSKRRISPNHTISKPIGIGTNNDAEWQAVLEGLEFAITLNDNDIYIYSDSLLVVNQANKKWKAKQPSMKEYLLRFDELSLGKNVNISWLPRQLTYLADKQT